ncbi:MULTISPECIES: RNA polymerase sigma factor [unclassified Imperialibacter]|uniref:RNA polymerase sigma factor n=1 Tax=unclassified Imperialibacter TaxID=2629706 RepID=UPI001259D647|nr:MULTISPECIES: sigma-70 family RNA polymerase sigma factor [unclassified Imperialibacter]CAD5279111.1 putative RNA polymerase, sigma-24 subunit, ECF subfamily [Imperialibacter sp. 89]CAD5293181.1 putative RNA polymerase, sigma-24 subunit, ECF subfamily [Imperialibacter sp. 75]VVS99054.1 putative RNA polymerase, sigma-24 subunit, ECF subfamily [Imperialibacter sp. EC-SDR9]
MSQFGTINEYSDESHLWDQLVRHGDKTALKSIYSAYARLLFNYGMHVTQNKDLVKDCIQDLFLELLKNHATLSKTSSIKYYLYKALRRKIVYEEKKIARQMSSQEHFLDTDGAEVFFEFSETVEKNNALNRKKILQSVHALPKKQQEVIQLIFFENLSRDEVAEILEIDANYLYTITWKAIKALRKALLPKQVIIHIVHILLGLSLLT